MFLYADSLVPTFLVETTLVVVIVLLVLSYFVLKGNMLSINVSTVLGIIAPIFSYLTPAHVVALEQIPYGGLIAFLAVLQLLGFYVFPIVFVILRAVYHGKLKNQIESQSRRRELMNS